MNNQNIKIGIDLGTTNSEVAISTGGSIEIVKNIFGDEYTPSVFGIDRAGNKIIGKKAYEKLFKDASPEEFKNNKAEVKRLMGTADTVHFERTGEQMTAEQISAEILKNLKEDVVRKHSGFDTRAAVITIPAYFSALQSEATKRAGNLAGFEHVVLLQEPIAAAMSYGFMNAQDENWLVYDLGGGTFDVALISSKEGSLTVLGQNGDNFLGGKDFDWLIIDKIIVPKLQKTFNLDTLDRSNPEYRSVFAKLKYHAEQVKVFLSQYDSYTIEVENIGTDDDGKDIYATIDISRQEFEELIKPLVDRTIDLAKKTITESGLKQTSVHKVILAGGPTQIPYVRQRLEDKLKIEIDTSADPLTAVARGACIFAASQRIPQDIIQKKETTETGTKNITLHYDSLTAEDEETVSGVIKELKDSDEEYYIQIQGDSGHYGGTKFKLKKGNFFDTVAIEPHKENLFWIYLFDGQGNPVPVDPDSFSITHGLSVSGAPLPHTIGIAVAKQQVDGIVEVFDKVFEKGDVLPLKSKPRTYHTIKQLKKGETDSLPIKVREGESDIPDRNEYICDLFIPADNLPYDLPAGTEVDITIEVTESREVLVNAFIPSIELSLNARATIHAENVDTDTLQTELHQQSERANKISENNSSSEQKSINNTIQSLRESLKNADQDEDEKRKADKQLRDLKEELDKAEKNKEMPQLIKDFRSKLVDVKELIEKIGSEETKERDEQQLEVLEKEGESAIANNDKQLLLDVSEQLYDLGGRVTFSNPAAWVHMFNKITDGTHTFTNEEEARYYIDKGKRAINTADDDELKRCVQNLLELMPSEEQATVTSKMSGITY